MPSKLFAPITIIHYPGPGGGHSIKHTYYFKAISGLVGRVGVEPTVYPTSRVYSPLQSPLCVSAQIHAVRWKQPQTPLRLSFITLFCLSILEEPDIAPIL